MSCLICLRQYVHVSNGVRDVGERTVVQLWPQARLKGSRRKLSCSFDILLSCSNT